MKQLPSPETMMRSLLALLLFPLMVAAQVFDTTPPKIAHQPVKLGREGRTLPIIANVSDNAGIKSVSIAIYYNEQQVVRAMNQVKSETSVPVIVQTSSEATPLYSTPGTSGKLLADLAAGELLEVTLLRPPFYRVRTATGVVGYVNSDAVQIVEAGATYRVTLPSQLTSGGRLAYQIFALDDFGNEAKTDVIQIRIISDEELARIQGRKNLQEKPVAAKGDTELERLPQKKSSEKILFAKPLFWVGAAVVGGGVYYLISGDDDEAAAKASVGLVVGW